MPRYYTRKPIEDLSFRFHITTPDRHREMAAKIGGGNISLGFRKAVEFYHEHQKSLQSCKEV